MTNRLDLKGHRRPVIGFLVDSLDDAYQQSVFAGVSCAAKDFDAHLVCFDSGRFLFSRTFETNHNILYDLIGPESVDGLLLLTGALISFSGPERLAEFLKQYSDLPLVSLSQAPPGVPSLISDNGGGIREIVRHLVLHHGLREIAFIGGPSTNQDAQERFLSFQDTMTELGVPFDFGSAYAEGDFTQDSGRKAMSTLLSRMRNKPDAVVAANDEMAVGAIDVILLSGFRVPQDVAVVGFDDIVIGLFCSPPLTSVAQNLEEQGYRGVEALIRLIRGEGVPLKTVLPTHPVIRESCGCYSESILHVPVADDAQTDAARWPPSAWSKEILDRIGGGAATAFRTAVQELVSTFQGNFDEAARRAFLETWQRFISEHSAAQLFEQTCQKLISELRRVALPLPEANGTGYRKGESLLHQARIMLGERLVYAEKRILHQKAEEQRVLNTLREELLAAFDEETLARSIARALPRLGIGECCIAQFRESGETAQEMHSVITMSMNPEVTGKENGAPFPSRMLIPRGIRTLEERTTWIAEAVAHFESMGYILLHLGTRNYQIYGEIRRIVSNTMQGVRLLRQAHEQNDNLRRRSDELKASLQSMRKLMGGVINTLYLTVETRDPYTAGHQQRVADLARCIATTMGLPGDQIEAIRLSSSVHDLGKLCVPSEILNKPGRLREVEFCLIQLHPEIAYDILKTIDFPWPIADIVLQHHERIDGSGYPRRLMGEQIKIEARIIGVADVVEAMASHRPYRPALGIEAALAEIDKERGRTFDASVVDICLDLFHRKGFAFHYDSHKGGGLILSPTANS
jgi:HD-GYP domain-containing protein (c-di-GMP phosphodiesterase class II)/DNA-binding LacI/PurR family transcriptional regulator